MINGIVKNENGFSVKDFEEGKVVSDLGSMSYATYMEAVEANKGVNYPESFYSYLTEAANISNPDADTWENMIFAGDYRGIYDGEENVYRNVTEMDRGAADDDEIAYVDALDATYKSLMAMVQA